MLSLNYLESVCHNIPKAFPLYKIFSQMWVVYRAIDQCIYLVQLLLKSYAFKLELIPWKVYALLFYLCAEFLKMLVYPMSFRSLKIENRAQRTIFMHHFMLPRFINEFVIRNMRHFNSVMLFTIVFSLHYCQL